MSITTTFNKSNIKMLKDKLGKKSPGTVAHLVGDRISDNINYPRWLSKYKASEAELNYQKKKVFTHNPLISIIVPTFNTPINFLDEMIGSL